MLEHYCSTLMDGWVTSLPNTPTNSVNHSSSSYMESSSCRTVVVVVSSTSSKVLQMGLQYSRTLILGLGVGVDLSLDES